jgi:hypothetical protein
METGDDEGDRHVIGKKTGWKDGKRRNWRCMT